MQAAECELRPNTPWAIINPDKFFIACSEGHQQGWPRVSEPDASITNGGWVIVAGGTLITFYSTCLHQGVRSASSKLCFDENNNLCRVSLVKLGLQVGGPVYRLAILVVVIITADTEMLSRGNNLWYSCRFFFFQHVQSKIKFKWRSGFRYWASAVL